jgi:CHAT domain-containing protein/Tfp pilus assembly protein PilF
MTKYNTLVMWNITNKPMIKTFKFIFLLIILSSTIVGNSQSTISKHQQDSLMRVWENPIQPAIFRIDALERIANDLFLFSQPDSAFHYGKILYDFAINKNYKKEAAYALFTQGTAKYLLGDKITALELFNKTLNLFNEIKNKDGIAFSNTNLAKFYFNEGDIDKSIFYHKESIKVLEGFDDSWGLINSYYELSKVYKAFNFLEDAIATSYKILEIAAKDGNKGLVAASYNDIAAMYSDLGNYVKSIELYQESINICHLLKDNKGIAEGYLNIGVLFYEIGDYKSALDSYENSIKLFTSIGDEIGIADCLLNSANIYINKGEYKQAEKNFEKCIETYKLYDYYQGLSIALSGLADLQTLQSNYNKSIQLYYDLMDLNRENNDENGLARTFNNLGVLNVERGVLDSAISYFEKAFKILEKYNDIKSFSQFYNNMALVFNAKGEFNNAIEYNNKSLKIDKQFSNKRGLAFTYNNLGNIYRELNDFEQSIDYFEKSLLFKTEIDDKKGMAGTLNNIGLIYQSSEELELASDYFNKSLKLYSEIGDLKGVALCKANLSNNFSLMRDYKKALEHIIDCEKIILPLDDMPFLASLYGNIGTLFLKINNVDSAIYYHELSLNVAKNFDLFETIKTSRRVLFSIYKNKNPQLASQNINNLREINEAQLNSNYLLLSENEKYFFINSIEKDFMLYHDYVLQNHNLIPSLAETSFNLSLYIKGLSLKSTSTIRQSILNSGNKELINQFEQWKDIKLKLTKLTIEENERYQLEKDANELERQLIKNSTALKDFDMIKNLKWYDVQSKLLEGEAAIEFIHFNQYEKIDSLINVLYAALIICKNSPHPEIIPLCSAQELEEVLKNKTGNSLLQIENLYGSQEKTDSRLYELIWKPMEKSLEGIQTVYYAPSGLLHKISFAAINKGYNEYLSDVYNLQQLSSTGKLVFPDHAPIDVRDQVLLMGGVQYSSDKTQKEVWNYLPGTLKEAQNINSTLSESNVNVQKFTAHDAHEENFKKEAGKAQILHIATHGFFYPDPELVKEEMKKKTEQSQSDKNMVFRGSTDYANWSFVINKNPLMRSGLVLAGANDVWDREALAEGEDGILTAAEISNLNLFNTKLVVLSACETGLGDIKGSEGVYGLQRAFKMAGVKQIIMSLWQVPDKETSEFMSLFYQKLLKEKDTRKAFTLTQKEMRTKYDPYYWAAFVLVE